MEMSQEKIDDWIKGRKERAEIERSTLDKLGATEEQKIEYERIYNAR